MKKGDHICVKTRSLKDLLTHHGIYCGDGTVIHFDGQDKLSGKAKIRRDSLEHFSGPFPVSEILVLQPCPSGSADTVIKKAESFLGKSGYDLFNNNCEHFASYCISGEWKSTQSDNAKKEITQRTRFAATRPNIIEVAKGAASGQTDPKTAAAIFVGAVVLTGAAAVGSYAWEKLSEMRSLRKSKPSGDGMFEVLASSGDTHLGDDDLDKKIVDFLADEFRKTEGIDLRRDKQALQRLTKAAQKARIELSTVTKTEINLPFITATQDGPIHLDTTLTRAKFEELCSN